MLLTQALKVLGFKILPTEAELKKEYKKLCRKYHPDLHVGKGIAVQEQMTSKFTELQTAYEVIQNAYKSKVYQEYKKTQENKVNKGVQPGTPTVPPQRNKEPTEYEKFQKVWRETKKTYMDDLYIITHKTGLFDIGITTI